MIEIWKAIPPPPKPSWPFDELMKTKIKNPCGEILIGGMKLDQFASSSTPPQFIVADPCDDVIIKSDKPLTPCGDW